MEFLKIPKLFASTFYAVPDYQRDYEWTNVQNMTLLDDVFALVESNEGSHFFGAIVTIPYEKSNGLNKSIDFEEYDIVDEKNIKHVVDGQQRLTSFSILAKALDDLIAENFTDDNSFVTKQKRKLEKIYFSTEFKGDNPAPCLILNGNTGACYNSAVLNVTTQKFDKKLKGAKRILAAYNFFKTEIPAKYNDLDDDLSKRKFYADLVEVLLNKVIIVEISCDASADAFQVFDSLNGKGLDLTAADRIKNVLMSWTPQDRRNQVWDDFAEKVGEDYLAGFFVSDFFYKRGRRISKNKLPDEFKDVYKECSQKDFDDFIQKLNDNGEIYGQLRSSSTSNKSLNVYLLDLKNLKMEQIYVMLFGAVLNYGIDVVEKKEYTDFVKELTKLVVRMQVCERNMNRLDVYFSRWIEAMKNQDSLAEVTNMVSEEIKTIVTDEKFQQSFSEFAPNDNKISEYYLIQLEEYLKRETKGDRTPVGRVDLSVEHIIPKACKFSDWYGGNIPSEIADTLKTDIIERIGNKALLYGDDNSSAKNNTYEKKVKVYLTGKMKQTQGHPYDTFVLIQNLVDDYPDKFTHEEVESRAKKMAEIVVKIW